MSAWLDFPETASPLRPARSEEAVLGVQPEKRVDPGSPEELAGILAWADASGHAVLPRGGGSKLGWGNPPRRADLVLSTTKLDRILDHPWADLTATVEAGCPFSKVQGALREHGQRLAIDPLFPERTTIGGLLSTNDSGSLRVRYGSLRDLIIGITIALPDGTLARSGGRVVKNVAGYDLPKLATGSLGTLGVITQATFRLHPLPQGIETWSAPIGGRHEASRVVHLLHDSQLPFAGLQVRHVREAPALVDVHLEGTQGGLDAQAQTLRALVPRIERAGEEVWGAREELFGGSGVVVKLGVRPSDLSAALALVAQGAGPSRAVFQGTGLGLVALEAGEGLMDRVRTLRDRIKALGGSLVVLERPEGFSLDCWGDDGDAGGLMRAVKMQFDPKGTLNPGRFAGGI
jgi:glycolate oxidase FAD binding subunit